MSSGDLITSGAILLTVVGIAYGGSFLLRVVAGKVPTNDLQRSYFRAGHAHAGVLVILGLVIKLLMAQASVIAVLDALSSGVLGAAILMPAGFFLSVIGRDPGTPNRWRYLIFAGGIVLTIGLVSAGVALIISGVQQG